MLQELTGKRVLITGGTSGVGLATARLFAQHGAKVAINGVRDPAQASCMLSELGAEAIYLQADLTKSEECQRCVAEFVAAFGGLDVLINNAGGLGERRGLEEIDDALFDRVMDLNARSALMVTKFAIPHLRQSAKASGTTAAVISTGSLAGREGGGIGAGVYAAAKAWLHDIHRNWVKEFTKDNIRFNIIAPGSIDTAFHQDKSPALLQQIAATIPMGRFGQVEEVAPSYLYLASHRMSGYVTGQVLDVNGGQLAP
ncbi:SDR family NAD(P)-dependent oxidoreductase [Motilimonas pumila]|uniref:SDR family oxidoreductase n=1 Tax=Motilimonas pumila TaxID=2303987 RepID=A0A418YHS3_9GAMM|nr:SDR family oxidoreductase [Motilimonas pumila]RJG49923.1 SDR family oxidoreductase [Motilimonas pumila]